MSCLGIGNGGVFENTGELSRGPFVLRCAVRCLFATEHSVGT
jgi:hypothetical protein